jgi:uncharacterized Zn finger protein
MKNQQQQINIGLEQTKNVSCENCENLYFVQQVRIQKVPGLLTGQSHPTYMPVPVFACSKCGHVNSEFETQYKQEISFDD